MTLKNFSIVHITVSVRSAQDWDGETSPVRLISEKKNVGFVYLNIDQATLACRSNFIFSLPKDDLYCKVPYFKAINNLILLSMNWWQSSIQDVFKNLSTSQQGLADDSAKSRLTEVGPNELIEKKRKPPLTIFLNQFKDFMIVVLLAAAIIAGIAGDLTDTLIIVVIVVLNAIVGFVQENKAEEAMEALKKISALHAHVRRNGSRVTLPAAELVPGDMVELEAGNVVPADIRLAEVHGLRINESALTGESVPAEKSDRALPESELSLGDRINMAYRSTLVTNGRAVGVVIATGMSTEIGSIAKMLQQGEDITPLQKRMADFGSKLSYLVVFICVVFFVIVYIL